MSSRVPVIQHKQGFCSLQPQRENFFFPAPQLSRERCQSAGIHRPGRHPGKPCQFRQGNASPPAFAHFSRHGQGHLNGPKQGWQEMQKTDLMQVLER